MAHEPVAVLDRAVKIMNLVTAENADLGIREISRRTGIHSATVHRLVATLQASGLLQQDPDTSLYRIGPLAFRWGTAFLNRAALREVATPHMARLRDQFDETIALSLQTGIQRVYMEQIESKRGVRTTIQVGSPYDLFDGAAGIALLSALPAPDFDGLVLERDLPEERLQQVRAAIDVCRERGFATSQQQVLTGVSAVSSSILDAAGRTWALSVLGPSARVDSLIEEIGDAVVEAAREICRRVAGSSPS
jgi:IclR family acetate operon transcriptional repressor